MKFFIIILRFIFFPIKIINKLIYGTPPPFIVGYSWYTQKDYGMMVQNAKDNPENLIPTFEQWKQHAEVQVQEMQNKNWMVFTFYSLKKMGESLILNFKELYGILGSYTVLPYSCKKFNYHEALADTCKV